MPHLIIGETFATVYNNGTVNLYKTEFFFGDVMSHLEENYPKMLTDISSHDEYLRNDIYGDTPFKLWGLSEGSSALCNMYKLINSRNTLNLTFKDVEDLRLYYHFESYQYNDSFFDDYEYLLPNEQAVTFKNLNTITQVLCSALYYYALNGYKICRCKHCGKWFATKTLKEEFCKRKSPCSDLEFDGKKLIGKEQYCKIAVDTIKKRLQGRKKSIYDKWKNGNFKCKYKCEECPYGDCIDDDERCRILCENYKRLRKNIKSSPTVDNIIKLHRYLYSDEMPKQERPNRRKSNAEKRRLMGL